MLADTTARRAYKPEEVASLLGIGRSTIYRLMTSGSLESVKVGGSRRITVEQLDRYLATLEAEHGAA